MSNTANGAGRGPAIPAILTALAIAIGAALYVISGTDALYLHAICAPFAIVLVWLTWDVPTLDERFARRAQAVRAKEKSAELKPAPAH